VKTYDNDWGDSLMIPIANLMNIQPTGEHLFTGTALDYDDINAFHADYPSLSNGDTFSVLWEGVFYIRPEDVGTWTLGTASDDGSVWYIDWNRDGDYADPGELVVDNNGLHGRVERTGNATFDETGCYPTALAVYENGGGENMEAKLAQGANLPYGSLDFLDGTPSSTHPVHQDCPTSAIALQNTFSDQVFHSTADVHADFEGRDSVFTLDVLYGPTNGGRAEAAWAQRHSVGVFTNTVSVPLAATLAGLLPETTYHFTYQAHNAAEVLWADPGSLSFGTTALPHLVEILAAEHGSPITVYSAGATGWDVQVEYSTDDLRLSPAMTWLPLPVLSNSYSGGVNTTTFNPPPADPARYFVRILNLPATP